MSRRTVIAGLLSAGAVLSAAACTNEPISLAGSKTAPSGPAIQPTTSAPAQQQQLPQGYRRVSDGTHSVSFDVTKLQKLGNDPAIQAQIQQITQVGGIFLADNESKQQSPNNFTTNVLAFCSPAPSISIEE
jgi:hypothetical protein